MKQILSVCIVPLMISVIAIFFIAQNEKVNKFLFAKITTENTVKPDSNYIPFFQGNSFFQEHFLEHRDSAVTIYLLGSSELTTYTPAIPYNFISHHFKERVISVGHAGNQCLSIFAQLLANEKRLKNAPIVIDISPTWFESKSANGTSSEVFLEFMTERFLKNIIHDENDSRFHDYLFNRVAQLYSEFSSPGLELKIMNFKCRASKSFIHEALYAPLIFCDKILLSP